MKRLANVNARDLEHASRSPRDARRGGRAVAFAGGGSDLLGLVKDRIIAPDVVVQPEDDQRIWTRSRGGRRPDASAG